MPRLDAGSHTFGHSGERVDPQNITIRGRHTDTAAVGAGAGSLVGGACLVVPARHGPVTGALARLAGPLLFGSSEHTLRHATPKPTPVMIRATASSTPAVRWLGWRSVLRRSCPEVRQPMSWFARPANALRGHNMLPACAAAGFDTRDEMFDAAFGAVRRRCFVDQASEHARLTRRPTRGGPEGRFIGRRHGRRADRSPKL
jgi:hypothetical protein